MGRDSVEKRIVEHLYFKYHDFDTTLRNLSRELGIPYSTVREAVLRLEAEGVVYVLRLEREHIVRLKSIEKALEKGYLPPEILLKWFGYIMPIAARKNGHYIGDEIYYTLPFRIRRHEAFARVTFLELMSRRYMDPHLARLGELPRFSLLFYRTVLVPEDSVRKKVCKDLGIECLGYYEPAYGFFAFLVYTIKKTLGISWAEAYCKALELIQEYIRETKAGESLAESLVDAVLENMKNSACKLKNTSNFNY
ncbi:Sugar-specific transcriptional regulator TrmB [Pyrobaculum oguniense TE7]|uniref:Sugar-specific transcriptional regulator TrmB n=1 Tax=Pyrobaculum oguniense (strain DSM 13380 / JCM 10595 / TE7) TaxID=698757 RepID=H6QBA6_PYROT|nr:Sugar-specific transcriptional regulator TrmB [Pyrobaculum oguniense TE7]